MRAHTICCLFLVSSLTLLAQDISLDSAWSILQGTWLGTGSSQGYEIQDSICFSQADVSEHHLSFYLREINGPLKMEGYLYRSPQDSILFYEFNNGQWPNRIFRGVYTNHAFHFLERGPNRLMSLTISVESRDALLIEEHYLIKEGVELADPEKFVMERLQRMD